MVHIRLLKPALTIVVLVLIFALAAGGCSNSSDDGEGTNTPPGNQEEYKTYTAYDADGNAFILIVTGNDTYVLSIQGTNESTLGSSTGTVQSYNNNSYGLRHNNGSSFTVIINVNIIVQIINQIPLNNGGYRQPPVNLYPTKPGSTSRAGDSYTVTFNANGGSGTPPASQTVTSGNSITLPSGSGLSRSGYSFVGWSTSSSSGAGYYQAGSSFTPTGNVVLYAMWKVYSGGGDYSAGPGGDALSGMYFHEFYYNESQIHFNNDGTYTWIESSSRGTRTGTYTVLDNKVTMDDGHAFNIYNSNTLRDLTYDTWFLKDGSYYPVSGKYYYYSYFDGQTNGYYWDFDSDGTCKFGIKTSSGSLGASSDYSYTISGRIGTAVYMRRPDDPDSSQSFVTIDSNTIRVRGMGTFLKTGN